MKKKYCLYIVYLQYFGDARHLHLGYLALVDLFDALLKGLILFIRGIVLDRVAMEQPVKKAPFVRFASLRD